MKTTVFEKLSAYANSDRFAPLLRGVDVVLPTGDTVDVRLQTLERSVRPVGLRLSKYAYICTVSAGAHVMRGFGESDSRLLAVQKCIAEGFERVIFKSLEGTPLGAVNSNGWAAHLSSSQAHASALSELLERDAVLAHWLKSSPMTEINLAQAPQWLSRWTANELKLGTRFRTLRVLVDTHGKLPTATTVLMDGAGHGVLSHATGKSLAAAVYKALVETCRIGHVALDETRAQDSLRRTRENGEAIQPIDHGMLYAHHEKLPLWLFGGSQPWAAAEKTWKARMDRFQPHALPHRFQEIVTGPLSVGFCTSDQVQELFFGRTELARDSGRLNMPRLRTITDETINLKPHCVA